MYAPIVLFVYNRASLMKTTYEALKQCAEAKDSELFIFADGPKNENSRKAVEQVRTELQIIKTDNAFKSVTCIESETNKGLAASIISGVSQIIKEYGKVIVLEDDCMPSPYFLHYMNKALEAFKDDKSIGSIAGYAEVMTLPKDYKSDIYLARRSCSSAWGTWRDRWNDIDWDLANVKDVLCNLPIVRRLNANGSDRLIRLYRQSKGKAGSWSICFGAHHAICDWWVVYPRYSYIWNNGNDGSGIHTVKGEMSDQSDLSLAICDPDIEKPNIDKRIQRMLKRQYSAGFISDIKRLFANTAIVLSSMVSNVGKHN